LSAGFEKNEAHTIYIGSLVKRYIQSHLTPRWIPLKQQTTHLQKLVVLEAFKNKTHNAEKPYFSRTNTSRNPIKKC